MSYYTVQAIIISLLVIIGIHYLITNVLFNEKKYKNKMKKKVIFKLPQEEDEKLESENVVPPQKSTDSSGDLSSMKNDIMEFMDTNEIYQRILRLRMSKTLILKKIFHLVILEINKLI